MNRRSFMHRLVAGLAAIGIGRKADAVEPTAGSFFESGTFEPKTTGQAFTLTNIDDRDLMLKSLRSEVAVAGSHIRRGDIVALVRDMPAKYRAWPPGHPILVAQKASGYYGYRNAFACSDARSGYVLRVIAYNYE